MTNPATTPEPPPIPHAGQPVWPLVIEWARNEMHWEGFSGPELVLDDMAERDAFGRARYGTPLCVGDGRDALVDLYQEVLDALAYGHKARLERPDESEVYFYQLQHLLSLAYCVRMALARRGANTEATAT